MAGKTIISIIVAWVGYMAITKWVWTPVKRNQDPIQKEDPASPSQTAAERPPHPGQDDDPASLLSSSPESRPPTQKHDVFLSFRGIDTRKSITNEIYRELKKKGVKPFMDNQDLVIGAEISPSLLTAIEESRFAVVVLSQNYASSPWCLEELTKIVQCMDHEDRILPLFYNVEPSDVRHQKKSYEIAFKEHEKRSRHPTEKLKQWRYALKKVANISGWNLENFTFDRELVKNIVESICSKLWPIKSECSMSTETFELFQATEEAIDRVMKVVKDDKVTAVGVYGIGGVGKTTMIKYVGAQAYKSGIFDCVIMVVVFQNPDLEKIQGILANLLGVELQEKTEMARAGRLHKEIMKKINLLIIFDDIWKILDLSRIGIPSYDKLKSCKSKVILTTRRLQVCHSMGCQVNISLNILSVEDSWKLFMKKARKSLEKSTKFYDISRKLARECGGLPIALITIARALEDKDLVEWERAAQRLKKSQSANPDDEGDAFECIKLSYDYLKYEDCKSCFLLCCLFPEDYDIPIADLIKYGIGKGLFRHDETIKEATETTHSIVKHLKNSSLLLDSEEDGCVRMHDVIRDTAIKIAESERGHGFFVKAGCGLEVWPCRQHGDFSVVSLTKNHIRKLPEQLVLPKLQILLLQDNESIKEIPETFFQRLTELRVLDLSGTSISLLPNSSSLLTNLLTLCLNRCKLLDDISIVGKLTKLEILSMKRSSFRELPREIGDLTNLRVLDISDGDISRIPSKLISNLHRLEELYLGFDFWDWGSMVEGQETNVNFEEVISLSHLRVLQVCISHAECIPKTVEFDPDWMEFDITIGKVPVVVCHSKTRRNVQINAISTLPDWFFNVVISKAEMVEWTGNLRLIDIFVEYKNGKLHGLKHLYFDNYCEYSDRTRTKVPIRFGHMGSGGGYGPHIWDVRAKLELLKDPVLENLEELHMAYLDSLEELCLDELPHGSLFNLKVLGVNTSDNWGNALLPAKLLKILPNLEKLRSEYMRKIEYVFGCEEFQPEQSKLREVILFHLTDVRSICNGPAPRAMFRTLERLSITSLNELRGSLFTSDVAQCLCHLEEVELIDCPLIQRILEASNEKIILPKLKSLKLMYLPELFYVSATIDFECPSLGVLSVYDCPQFSVSISDFRNRSR